ncbi:DUF5916 domain-containing protein [Sungkyunkwania multivorans]|uniref:DUF5916 domain-containing protein n=1 Tax=Sungkyunkwania multivorans TaxID=1173618 RepID=A0ABW3CXU1_9FLAO
MSKFILFCSSLIITFGTYSQEKKVISATRIDTSPKIDGVLDDNVWKNIQPAKNFFMLEPANEGVERETHRTEVKMAYDDKAVYLAAYMFDNEPSKVQRQFSQRDDIFVQADHFSFALNTYNDGINEVHFLVTSAGTIGDAIVSGNNFDFSYNVVWQCNVSFDEKGWYAEFKIPYNALRFPQAEEQNWSANFRRRITHLNETYVWNQIDRSVGLESQYNGLVEGIRNIDPPLRLTLYPFAQGLVQHFDNETTTNLTAGMDIKYGLSDAFTLDATLIPDFGQAAFDEVQLNLGPFEQVFDENRAFFTEGTDLFNKGGLFFSRRVGGAPSGDIGTVADNEEIIEEPSKVGLLNALKISGRTKGNLGVGFFNAVTERTEARIRNLDTDEVRNVLVEPLANYNIFVVDQLFNKNSSVTLINTNVTRDGSFRDANVTGFLYDVSNKANSWNFEGGARVSNVVENGVTTTGLRTNFEVRRTKGNFRYGIANYFANDTYDANDLGLNFRNNFNNVIGEASYEIFEPTKRFNKYRIDFRVAHRRLYKPSVQTENSYRLSSFFVTKERFAFGGNVNYNSKSQDYFEPRVAGRFVTFLPNIGGALWVSSDYRKKFAYDATIAGRNWFNEASVGDEQQSHIFLELSPRYRFSDKFLLIWRTELFNQYNNFGYIDDDGTDVFLGRREVRRIENSLQASYNFDSYKAIDLRFRNFWSTANYKDEVFYLLNDDGTRTETPYDIAANDPNRNFNIWNLDLSFRWRFSPGSEAILLYRNQAFNDEAPSTENYIGSLGKLFDNPTQHTLSLRIVYFIDVNNLKNSFKG